MLTGHYMGVNQTNGGMIGDSSVAMARVFYVDALSLRRINDAATFDHMIATMQADQLRNTWMAERYNCEGLSTHDPFYHEYPEIIAMVLQKVKYGIDIGLSTVTVLPWVGLFRSGAHDSSTKAHAGPLHASFRYSLSGTQIEYTCRANNHTTSRGCSLSVDIQMKRLSGNKRFVIGGFEPVEAVQWRVTTLDRREDEDRGELTAADVDGIVEVNAPTGAQWKLSLVSHELSSRALND